MATLIVLPTFLSITLVYPRTTYQGVGKLFVWICGALLVDLWLSALPMIERWVASGIGLYSWGDRGIEGFIRRRDAGIVMLPDAIVQSLQVSDDFFVNPEAYGFCASGRTIAAAGYHLHLRNDIGAPCVTVKP